MKNVEKADKLFALKTDLFNEISKEIIGQKAVIEQLFIALLCRGHVLLEGVPGLAKTLMIKSFSSVMELKFNRVQFTPDLMPSDITGTEIIQEDQSTGTRAFKFHQGPLFSNIVLADEINRTPPKTQAALLEAMQEQRVTAGGKTYELDKPFFVLATQNPIEQEGTYPLPEAQLDRFLFKLKIEYPTIQEEIDIVQATTTGSPNPIIPVMKKEDILDFQNLVLDIPVAENVVEFAVDFVGSTRPNDPRMPDNVKELIDWGAGPRASSALILAAKARALLDNRTTPDINDVRNISKLVLRHRIIRSFNAESEGISTDNILDKLLKTEA